jgi:hypothetical protein
MAFDAISERVAQMGESFRGFFRPEELVEDLKNIWLPSRRESHDRPDERDIFSVSPGRSAGPRPSRWPDLDYDVRVIRLSGMSLDPDSRIPILKRLRDSAAAWFAGKLAILNVGGRVRAVIKDEGLQGPRKRTKPQAGRGGAVANAGPLARRGHTR